MKKIKYIFIGLILLICCFAGIRTPAISGAHGDKLNLEQSDNLSGKTIYVNDVKPGLQIKLSSTLNGIEIGSISVLEDNFIIMIKQNSWIVTAGESFTFPEFDLFVKSIQNCSTSDISYFTWFSEIYHKESIATGLNLKDKLLYFLPSSYTGNVVTVAGVNYVYNADGTMTFGDQTVSLPYVAYFSTSSIVTAVGKSDVIYTYEAINQDQYFDFTLLANDTYSVRKKRAELQWPEYMVIPKEYNGKAVTKLEDLCEIKTLKGVIVLSNIVEMGSYTFGGCTALTDVMLPDSLKSIPEMAFIRCESLVNINCASVANIGRIAFATCMNLENIILNENVVLAEGCFNDCPKLMLSLNANYELKDNMIYQMVDGKKELLTILGNAEKRVFIETDVLYDSTLFEMPSYTFVFVKPFEVKVNGDGWIFSVLDDTDVYFLFDPTGWNIVLAEDIVNDTGDNHFYSLPGQKTVLENWLKGVSSIPSAILVSEITKTNDAFLYHDVTFSYGDNKTSVVPTIYAQSVVAPTNTEKEISNGLAYFFDHWDQALTNIREAKTITAVYTTKEVGVFHFYVDGVLHHTYTYSEYIALNKLPEFVFDDKSISGWYLEEALTTKLTYQSLLTEYMKNLEDINIYADVFYYPIPTYDGLMTITKSRTSVLLVNSILALVRPYFHDVDGDINVSVAVDNYTGYGNVIGNYILSVKCVNFYDMEIVVDIMINVVNSIGVDYLYGTDLYLLTTQRLSQNELLSILKAQRILPYNMIKPVVTSSYFENQSEAGIYEATVNYTDTVTGEEMKTAVRLIVTKDETVVVPVPEKLPWYETAWNWVKANVIETILLVVVGIIVLVWLFSPKKGVSIKNKK